MMKRLDLTDKKFGETTAKYIVGSDIKSKALF